MNAPKPAYKAIPRVGPVKQISLAYVFRLALQLEDIERLPDSVKGSFNLISRIWNIELALENLLNESVFSDHFRSSHILGKELLGRLGEISEIHIGAVDENMLVMRAKAAYSSYKIALLAEIDSFYSYFVTQKGGYDTFSLLQRAEVLFPDELRSKVPEAVFDIQEAGRSLAFERSTAAGFHIFRAVESVVRRYWAHVSDGKAPPKVRSLGVYVAAMERNGAGDPKVVAALRQLNTLHRNPLAHPEVALTMDETTAILGASQSVISAMLAGLPLIKPTTSQMAAGGCLRLEHGFENGRYDVHDSAGPTTERNAC